MRTVNNIHSLRCSVRYYVSRGPIQFVPRSEARDDSQRKHLVIRVSLGWMQRNKVLATGLVAKECSISQTIRGRMDTNEVASKVEILLKRGLSSLIQHYSSGQQSTSPIYYSFGTTTNLRLCRIRQLIVNESDMEATTTNRYCPKTQARHTPPIFDH
jgi:hypothetical protein